MRKLMLASFSGVAPDHAPVWLVAGVVALAYAYGAGRRAPGPWRAAAFVAGLAFTLALIGSPLGEWSEALFSLHMAQHLGLILIGAPLFVLAGTSAAFARTTTRLLRRCGARAPSPLLKFSRALAHPVCVWLAFSGLFVFWHLPGPYVFALHSEAAHALEHASFFLGAFGFWSVAMARAARPPGDGARLLFVSTAALLSALPGALIALSSRPLYPVHAAQAARFGLTALEDQQLAGLLMWGPMGLAYLIVILALLARWFRAGEARARRAAPLLALLPLLAGGCDATTTTATAQRPPADGDPREGAKLIAAIGCGACHDIPGINGAVGLVGPPLDRIGRRAYIAGVLRNTPENLQAWLQDPQKYVPGVIMPNLGLSTQQSRDIAAYLSTLR
jgi:putative membrane protein